jgi:hypothetical protein
MNFPLPLLHQYALIHKTHAIASSRTTGVLQIKAAAQPADKQLRNRLAVQQHAYRMNGYTYGTAGVNIIV